MCQFIDQSPVRRVVVGGHKTVQVLFALVCAITLAACQSTDIDGLAEGAGVPAGPVQADETIGAGGTRIAVFLPRSAGGTVGRHARDLRDGAALALDDLGGGQLTLTVHDSGARGNAAALLERAAGARLILGPATASKTASFVSAGARPPVLAFVDNGAPRGNGVYAMMSDRVDSVLEAARIVAGAGRKTFAAVAPGGFGQSERVRLKQGIEATGATLAGFVEVSGSGAALTSQITRQRELLVKADAVVIFGEGSEPADIASALRSASALQPNATLIGNLAWSAENFARPELDGALVTMPDQSGLALIADRYKARTGRNLTIQAAYGYDAVAVAAGVVRSAGADALTTATLTKNSGFRGTTGIFRFRADGSVDRPLALYQIKGGSLQLLDAAPEGF